MPAASAFFSTAPPLVPSEPMARFATLYSETAPIRLSHPTEREGRYAPAPPTEVLLKRHSDLRHHGPGLQEVCLAEGRKKIVQRGDIGKICDFDRRRIAPLPFPVQQVVGADAEIQYVPRLHPVWIVIVILRAREQTIAALRQCEQLRRNHALRTAWADAIGERTRDRGKNSVAGQANRYLLIGRKRQGGARIGHSAHHQSAVEAIRERDPFCIPRTLVAQIHSGLKRLIVIDTEHAPG